MSIDMFKPGDIVTVRRGLDTYKQYGNINVNDDMSRMGGESFVISRVIRTAGQAYPGYYLIKDNDWCWTDEMLEEHIRVAELDTNSRCDNSDISCNIQKSDLIKLYLLGGKE